MTVIGHAPQPPVSFGPLAERPSPSLVDAGLFYVTTDSPPRVFVNRIDSTGQHEWEEIASSSVATAADVYLDSVNGNDSNPGTITSPVATLDRARELLPLLFSEHCRLHMLGAGPYTVSDGDWLTPLGFNGAERFEILGDPLFSQDAFGGGAGVRTIAANGVGGVASLVAAAPTTTSVTLTAGDGPKFPVGFIFRITDGTTGALLWRTVLTQVGDTITFAAIANAPLIGSAITSLVGQIIDAAGGLLINGVYPRGYYRGGRVRFITGAQTGAAYSIKRNNSKGIELAFAWLNPPTGAPVPGDQYVIEFPTTVVYVNKCAFRIHSGSAMKITGVAFNGVGPAIPHLLRYEGGAVYNQFTRCVTQNGRVTVGHDAAFRAGFDMVEQQVAFLYPDDLLTAAFFSTGDLGAQDGGLIECCLVSDFDLIASQAGYVTAVNPDVVVVNQGEADDPGSRLRYITGLFDVANNPAFPNDRGVVSAVTGVPMVARDGARVEALNVDLSNCPSRVVAAFSGASSKLRGCTGDGNADVVAAVLGGRFEDDGTNTITASKIGLYASLQGAYFSAAEVQSAFGGIVAEPQIATLPRRRAYVPADADKYVRAGSAALVAATGFANGMPSGVWSLLVLCVDATLLAGNRIAQHGLYGTDGWLVYRTSGFGAFNGFRFANGGGGFQESFCPDFSPGDVGKMHLLEATFSAGIATFYRNGVIGTAANFASYVAPTAARTLSYGSDTTSTLFPASGWPLIEMAISPTAILDATQIQARARQALRTGYIPLLAGETFRKRAEKLNPLAPQVWTADDDVFTITSAGAPVVLTGF